MYDIADVVVKKLKERGPAYGNRDWNQASRVGATCARELVYWRLHPELALPPDDELQIIFRHGNWMEREAVGQLESAGFEVSERDASFEWKAMQLRGRVDGKIRLDGEKRPLEIKGYAPQSWEKLNSIDDFLSSTKEYLRKVPSQLLSYLLLDGKTDTAVLYLLNKLTGKPKTILLHLEGATLDWGEALLKKLQLVNACVEEDYLPERIVYDETVCGNCPFRASCLTEIPASARGPAVLSGEDENELLGLLVERENLVLATKRYDAVQDEIKRLTRGNERVVVGDWLIVNKDVVQERVDTKLLPPEIKAKCMKESKYTRTSISNLKEGQKTEE